MNKEEIKHFKSLLRQGSLRHMNILLDDKFQKELLTIIKDYEKLQQENQELKKQLEESQENIILLKASKPMLEYKKALEENQQKKFIEYLENCINELKKESMNKLQNTINLGIVDITKVILSKYKEIIGGKDE